MERDGDTEFNFRKPARYGLQFPLLWVLIPQIFAYAFCFHAPWASEFSVYRYGLAGLLFLAIAVGASISERFFEKSSPSKTPEIIWKASFPLGAFFIFCAWWTLTAPPIADWSEKPPCEVELTLRVERVSGNAEKNHRGIAVIEAVSDPSCTPLIGTQTWFSIRKEKFRNADNTFPVESAVIRARGVLNAPDFEDSTYAGFAEFLRRERVSTLFSRADYATLLPNSESAFSRWCAETRDVLKTHLLEISDSGTALSRAGRLLGAMLLGDKSLLLPDQKENFLLTGTMHIFAVSGLHVSILAAGALFFFRGIRLPATAAWIAALIILWGYVQIVGAPPSAMRAWSMAFFLFLGCLFGRGKMLFHGLLCAAFFALLTNPQVINNAGFRLSYLVVAAILLYGIPAAEILNEKTDFRRWIPYSAASFALKSSAKILNAGIVAFCISVAAFLAGTPIIIAMFGICTFLPLIANLILTPLVALAVWGGSAAVLIALLPGIGTLFGKWVFGLTAVPLVLVDYGTASLAKIPAFTKVSFPHSGIGTAGSLLMLGLFFAGENISALRNRPLLRFALPPIALLVFLLIFAVSSPGE